MFEILIFLFPLLGIGFPIYIYILFKLIIIQNKKFSISKFDFLSFVLIFIYFFIRTISVSFDALFYIVTYYFGFILFYLYFSISKRNIDLYLVLKILCFEVIIEAILINTIIPASLLLNYPTYTLDSPHYKLFFGFFQRPYSIGSNATVTSSIILIIYIYVSSNFKLKFNYELLIFITFIICLSGTGIALYLFYILITHFNFRIKHLLIFLSLILLLFLLIPFFEQSDFSKFSSIYINGLLEFKIQQIEDYFYQLNDFFQLFFGKNHTKKFDVVTFNDFALNDAFYNLGFLGLILILVFLISKMNRYNYMMVLFFLIGALHYGAIFSISGQFLLGYILNISHLKKM